MKIAFWTLIICATFCTDQLAYAESKYPSRQIQIHLKGMADQKSEILDLEKFEKTFKLESMTTESPYEKGNFQFEGIPLSRFISEYSSDPVRKVLLKAIDGYVVEWSAEEIKQYSPFLACKKNGNYLTTKDKGTFRIVMDYSNNKPSDEKKYTPKWIWQINEIEFVK